MNFRSTFVAVMAMSALVGCGHHSESSSNAKFPETSKSPTAPVVTKEDLAAIKFPVAIVVEGGLTDKAFSTKKEPKFRLYLCLKNSDVPQKASVNLDLAALIGGLDYESVYDSGGQQETSVVVTARSMAVGLSYTAATKVSEIEGNLYAWGESESTVSLQPKDGLLKSLQGPLKIRAEDLMDEKLEHYSKGTLASSSTSYFGSEAPKYISTTILRMAYSPDRNKIVKTPCEDQNDETVLLTGPQLAEDIATQK